MTLLLDFYLSMKMGMQHSYQKLENNNTTNKPHISNITQIKRHQKNFSLQLRFLWNKIATAARIIQYKQLLTKKAMMRAIRKRARAYIRNKGRQLQNEQTVVLIVYRLFLNVFSCVSYNIYYFQHIL